MITPLSKDDIAEYIKNNGVRSLTTIRVLGKLYSWIEKVLNEEPGASILHDDIRRHEELLMKMYENDITEEERIELKYLRTRIEQIASRVLEYQRRQSTITGGSNGR